MLAVVVMVAAGIRLVFWLLAPVWPYLLAASIVFTVVRLVWLVPGPLVAPDRAVPVAVVLFVRELDLVRTRTIY